MTPSNVTQIIDAISARMGVPASVVWRVAMQHNFVMVGVDFIYLLIAVAVVFVGINVARAQLDDEGKISYYEFPGWVVFGCLIVIVGVCMFLGFIGDFVERIGAPQYCAAQDIVATVRGAI